MVNLCEKYDATVIQQLYKVVTGDNGELTTKKAFPVSLIQSTFDAGTGTRLDQILALNNCVWLPFAGDKESTRLQVESGMRREGLIVVFKNSDGEIYSQMYVGKDSVSDDEWKSDSKWKDVFVSSSSLGIVDSLTSDSSTEALSARQGKILDEKISALKSMDVRVVDSLPEKGSSGVIYLIKNDKSTSKSNTYKGYIWMSDEGKYEELGTFGDITVDTELSETSENPVQNRVITTKLNELEEKTQNPVIEVSLNKASFSSAFSSSFKTEAGTGTVTSHTWDEIRKFIQNEIPLRFLFEGLDIATPTEVSYQDAEDGYYSGIVSTADFRREFRIDHTLTVDITDTYYPETFIFETETGTTGEDESVTYKVATYLDTIKSCIAAAKARKGNQRIVVNTPDGRSCEFSLVYPRTDSLRASTSFGDTGYALSLSSTEDESTLTVQTGIIDLSDYYTKEETNTKLSGYVLKENIKDLAPADEEDLTLYTKADSSKVIRLKDRDTTNGMGYKILRLPEDKILTQDMINEANTIYEIRYDFDLNGATITVPEGCTLKFEGGSLKNGSMVFSNTFLSGSVKLSIGIEGSIKNDLFDVTWLDYNDIGECLNLASQYFNSLLVPQGSFTFNVPIKISGVKELMSYAELIYDGDLLNCEGIFVIKDARGANISLNSLTVDGTKVDYTDSRTINCVGVEIVDCNECLISINSISYFNENLRVSGLNGGCSYNHFYLGVIFNGNFNIRLYQQDSEAKASWVNENIFHSGRLTNFTNSFTYGRCFNIGIGGVSIDFSSYAPSSITDSYDRCNGIMFENMSLEGSGEGKITGAILCKNTRLSLLNNREEAVSNYVSPIGSFYLEAYQPKYSNTIFNSDFSYCTEIELPKYLYSESLFNNISINAGTDRYISDRVCLVNTLASPIFSIDPILCNNFRLNVGVIIDTSASYNKILKARISDLTRFLCVYLDDNYNNITSEDLTPPTPYTYFSSTYKGYLSGTDTSIVFLKIPSAVTKVFIGIDYSKWTSNLMLYVGVPDLEKNNPFILPNLLKRFGESPDRPIALPINETYFDTTLNRPVWWDGFSWVDPTESKQDKPTTEALTNAQTIAVACEFNKLYSGSSITSLTITAAKTDSSQNGAEEVFQFSTGTTTPTITITGVSWANSDTPTFEAGKTYEIHIMYNSTLDKFLATYATYD